LTTGHKGLELFSNCYNDWKIKGMFKLLISLLFLSLLPSLSNAQDAKTDGKIIVSVAGKKDVEKLGRKMCEVSFNIQNGSFGTINDLNIRLQAENDRGQKIRAFGFAAVRNVKRYKAEPIPKGSTLANASAAAFEEECKYLKSIAMDRKNVNESSCNIRMMPEDASCGRIITIVNEGEAVASVSNSIINKLVKGTVYKYYADGSCRESKKEKCLDKASYEQLCKNADGISKNTVSMAAVMYNYDYSQWIQKSASLRQLDTKWTGFRCEGGFTASGMWRGSSKTEIIRGGVRSFVYNQEGKILVHWVANY
jgi:hypothetical protein